jgi:hypothetical protein
VISADRMRDALNARSTKMPWIAVEPHPDLAPGRQVPKIVLLVIRNDAPSARIDDRQGRSARRDIVPTLQSEIRDLAIDWSRHIRPTQPPFSIEPDCVGRRHGNLVKLQRLFLSLQSCFGIALLSYALLLRRAASSAASFWAGRLSIAAWSTRN